MDPFDWTCPFCQRDVTITESSVHSIDTGFTIENSKGPRLLRSLFIVCPNKNCKKFTLQVALYAYDEIPIQGTHRYRIGRCLQNWNLIPPSEAKVFPEYVPKAINSDYQEACLIKNLSPKASATLARRCIQGILRDFWGVKPGRLVDEIKSIKEKIDPLTWSAINAVREIGNIGAHMEEDINLIIDVEPNEAQLLISLIETLVKDWYIVREERKKQLAGIMSVAKTKDEIKSSGASLGIVKN